MSSRREEAELSEKLAQLSKPLLLLITLMACIGFGVLYSAAEGHMQPWALPQIIRFMVFFCVMILIAVIDIRFWLRYAYHFYILALIFLFIAEIAGHTAMGATRWVRLGPFNLQPSEPMKLCMVFALARYFHSMNLQDIQRKLPLLLPIAMIVVPVVLILKQPDLGTALILMASGAMIFFAAGVKLWKFVLAFVLAMAAIPVIWTFGLHDYQKQRVRTFLEPESDPLGAGYNILQSKIAIGSGGFWGKGILQGTQSQLSFLPEKQTDFIFTMMSEEWGFMGGILVLSLYTLIIAYGYFIALSSNNHFGRLLAIGVISIFFLHVFVNIAMVTGLVPVVGEALPLLSYGGTMMATALIGFGLLLNVQVHRNVPLDRTMRRMGF